MIYALKIIFAYCICTVTILQNSVLLHTPFFVQRYHVGSLKSANGGKTYTMEINEHDGPECCLVFLIQESWSLNWFFPKVLRQ